jgi:hypothetical protein
MNDSNEFAAKTPKSRMPKKAAMSQEAEFLLEISAKLDRVIAVLAAQGKDRERQIDILSAAGCESNFIGTVVGMTGSSVRSVQSRRREKAAQSTMQGRSAEAV